VLSLAARIAHTGSNPLDDKLPFKLGHRTDDLNHKASARRGEINVVPKTHECDAPCFQVGQAVHQVPQRTSPDGHSSAALLSELGKREQELDKISEDLLAADGRGFDAKLQEIEAFVQKRLQDIRGLLFADVPRAKAELSKHCTAITLTPEGSTFRISGD
jgi:hypothetical protein